MKTTQRPFFILIALIGGLAIFSSTLSKTPVLPLFAQSLHATPAEIGWIVMASTIPGILVSYPAGALSDYLGKQRVLLASLVVFATAPFLYLLIETAWQLMAVRFYHGFATAIFGTVASAAIAERYTAGMSERLNISRQFARSIFIYFLGLSFHAIATGSDTDEYNKQVDFLNVIFRPLIVDANHDVDKAARKFKVVYKTFLANLPVVKKETVKKKMENTQTLKAGKELKKTRTKQKLLVSNKSNKKQ